MIETERYCEKFTIGSKEIKNYNKIILVLFDVMCMFGLHKFTEWHIHYKTKDGDKVVRQKICDRCGKQITL